MLLQPHLVIGSPDIFSGKTMCFHPPRELPGPCLSYRWNSVFHPPFFTWWKHKIIESWNSSGFQIHLWEKVNCCLGWTPGTAAEFLSSFSLLGLWRYMGPSIAAFRKRAFLILQKQREIIFGKYSFSGIAINVVRANKQMDVFECHYLCTVILSASWKIQ